MDDIKNPYNSRKKRSDWFDWWLADEQPAPAAREEIRHFRVKQASTYKPRIPTKPPVKSLSAQPNADGKSLVINLSLPKLKLPKFNLVKVNAGKYQLNLKIADARSLVACMGVLVILVFGISHIFFHHPASSTDANPEVSSGNAAANVLTLPGVSGRTNGALQAATTSNNGSAATKIPAGGSSPNFTPVVPVTEPELAKSPPVKSAYDIARKVYTVMDNFKGSPATINEQKLQASNATAAQEAVKQNADQIKANQPLTLANGATAYLASQGKAQTAVLAVGNVLIYVNSLTSHSNDEWRDYLNLFQ